jgi:hypothetical protein
MTQQTHAAMATAPSTVAMAMGSPVPREHTRAMPCTLSGTCSRKRLTGGRSAHGVPVPSIRRSLYDEIEAEDHDVLELIGDHLVDGGLPPTHTHTQETHARVQAAVSHGPSAATSAWAAQVGEPVYAQYRPRSG